MINKNLLRGFGIGIMSVASLNIFNKIINEYSKKYILMRDEGYYYTWKEGAIHYNVKGSGPKLLLVHNLDVLSSSYDFYKIYDELSKNHTVYTIDLLGCGLSDKPDIVYTCYTYVKLLTDFYKDVIRDNCDVVAVGDACNALLIANQLDNLYNKVILINPPKLNSASMTTTRHDLILRDIMKLPDIGTMVYNYNTRLMSIRRTLTNSTYNREDIYRMTLAAYEASHTIGSKGKYLYASKMCSYLDCDISNALKSLSDIHIIRGIETDSNVSNDYCKINPDITVAAIAGAKDLPHIENPSSTLREMVKILS